MTIEQCRRLHKGDKVKFSLGNGWYQEATFLKMTQVTYHGRFTLETMDQIDWRHGRTEWRADVEWTDENGRREQWAVRPSRLKMA